MSRTQFNLNTGLYTIFADSVTTPILRGKNGPINCMSQDFAQMGLLNGVNITSLQSRVGVAEGNIVQLQQRVGVAESNITSLGTRLGAAEMILIAHDEQLFTLDTRVDTAESNIVALTAFDTSLRTQLVSEKVLFNKASTYNTPFTGSFNELRDLPDLGGYTWTDYLGWSLDAAGILFDAAGGWAALTNWLGFSSAVPQLADAVKDALTKDNPDGSPQLTVRWQAVKNRPIASNSYDIGLLGSLHGSIASGTFRIKVSSQISSDIVYGAKFAATGTSTDFITATPKYSGALALIGVDTASINAGLLNINGDMSCTGLVSGVQGLIGKLSIVNTPYLPADPARNFTYLYNSTQSLSTPGIRLYDDGAVAINRVGVPTGAKLAISGKVDIDNSLQVNGVEVIGSDGYIDLDRIKNLDSLQFKPAVAPTASDQVIGAVNFFWS